MMKRYEKFINLCNDNDIDYDFACNEIDDFLQNVALKDMRIELINPPKIFMEIENNNREKLYIGLTLLGFSENEILRDIKTSKSVVNISYNYAYWLKSVNEMKSC